MAIWHPIKSAGQTSASGAIVSALVVTSGEEIRRDKVIPRYTTKLSGEVLKLDTEVQPGKPTLILALGRVHAGSPVVARSRSASIKQQKVTLVP